MQTKEVSPLDLILSWSSSLRQRTLRHGLTTPAVPIFPTDYHRFIVIFYKANRIRG